MKILLVKLNHIGDTLLLTPTIHFLRQQYPQAEIDVVVRGGCEAILVDNPDLSRLFSLGHADPDRRSAGLALRDTLTTLRHFTLRRYDFAFDLSGSDRAKILLLLSTSRVRGANDQVFDLGWKRHVFNRLSHFNWSGQHQVLRDFRSVADVMGLAGEPGPLVLKTPATLADVQAKVPHLQVDVPWALIHPTTRWAYKQWLPERWAEVADSLATRHGLRVIFSCGPAPSEVAHIREILRHAREPHLSTEGRLSLRELARLTQRASLLLCVDTLAAHIGAAMQTPTVVLFAKAKPEAWGPWRCPCVCLTGDCSCRRLGRMVCPRDQPYRCVAGIPVAQVLAAAEQLLRASNPTTAPQAETAP